MKMLSATNLADTMQDYHQQNLKVVFVHGVFDIIHKGHATLLIEAKKLGDILVVGVEHDDNARHLKGPERPIHNHDARCFVVSAFEPVDHVLLIPPYTTTENLNQFYVDLYLQIKPDIVATCVEAGPHGSLKEMHAKQCNARFVNIPEAYYDRNTSKVIELLKAT